MAFLILLLQVWFLKEPSFAFNQCHETVQVEYLESEAGDYSDEEDLTHDDFVDVERMVRLIY